MSGASSDLTSVVVVNFNGRRFLAECLSALERQTVPRHCYEILLIDNGSRDGSIEYARDHFPSVRVYPAGCNLGFAAGNNLGFALARGRRVVLLNNDTRVEPGWLAGLLAAADADDRLGGVTSRILFRDAPQAVNSTGLVLYRDGRGGDRDLGAPARAPARAGDEVFGGCGASLLLRRELLDELGGFDPKLFMYYEDLDLCWRAQLRGWRFAYAPASVVYHVGGGSSTAASPFLLRQIERNRVLVAIRNATPFLALWSLLGIVLRAGRLLLRYATARRRYGLTAGHVRAMLAAAADVVAALPTTLLQRYGTRVAGRRVPDVAITRWMQRPPSTPRTAA